MCKAKGERVNELPKPQRLKRGKGITFPDPTCSYTCMPYLATLARTASHDHIITEDCEFARQEYVEGTLAVYGSGI